MDWRLSSAALNPSSKLKCRVAVTVTTITVCEGDADRCLHEGIALRVFNRWETLSQISLGSVRERISSAVFAAGRLHRSARGL